MSGFVLYRDHDGWFRWTTAEVWDRPAFYLEGQRVDTRVEIGRFPTRNEVKDVRHAYNMMVHGKPTPNETYNKALARRANTEDT